MRSKFKWIFTLLIAFTMQFSFAQEKTVTGVVTDGKLPMPAANVIIKGTKGGVSTDMDGKFSIKAKPGDVLVVSFTGYESKPITVGSANSYTVGLKENAKTLDEVVVTGAMGIKKRKDALVSSQQVVSGKEIGQAMNPNAVQALAGKVSGLTINTGTGINPSTSIVLRGSRTLTGNAQALIVIDNAVSNAGILSQIPPDMIDNMNVIKGQQGAALYGEQGSNGVIIVTTKRGSGSNKASVTINSAVDFTSVLFTPDTQMKYGQGWTPTTGEDFDDGTGLQANHTPVENGSWGPAFNAPNFAGTLQATGLPLADGSFRMLPWEPIKGNISKFFNTGTTLQNGATINMGNEDGYALLSINKLNTDYVVQGDNLVKNTFLFKGGKKIGKLTVAGIVTYVNSVQNQTDSGLYSDLLNTPVNVPVQLFSAPDNYEHWTIWNTSPYWEREHERYKINNNVFNGNASIAYEFNKHISAKYSGNVLYTTSTTQYHNDGQVYDHTYNLQDPYTFNGSTSFTYQDQQVFADIKSSYYQQVATQNNFYGDLITNFNYDLSKKLNLKFNVGNTIQDNSYIYQTVGGLNLVKPGIYSVNNIAVSDLNTISATGNQGDTPTTFTGGSASRLINTRQQTRRVAGYFNGDLAYQDYLFFNGTARYEKSSVIKTSQFYPGAGVSFLPTKAFEGMKDKNTLNYLKLYGSYVVTGNSTSVSPYQTYGAPGAGNQFTPISYLYPQSQTSGDIKPEFVSTTEVGFNTGFFKNRITLDAAFYQSNTKDLINNTTTSSAAGFQTNLTNIGALRNRGMEIDLGLTPIKTASGFTWTLRSSFTKYNTVVTDLGLDGNANPVNVGTLTYAVKGESFPMLMGSGFQRDANGSIIVDANGIPLQTTGNIMLGKVTPDYILGFTNSFEYKGVKFTAVLDYRTGNHFYSDTKNMMTFAGTDVDTANFDRDAGHVWPNSVNQNGTPNTKVISPESYVNYVTNGSYRLSLREPYVIDGTALKIRELTIGYSLPFSAIKGIGIKSLSFSVNARNPFVLFAKDNRMYADPETGASGYSSPGQYPTTKSFGFSMNLNF